MSYNSSNLETIAGRMRWREGGRVGEGGKEGRGERGKESGWVGGFEGGERRGKG